MLVSHISCDKWVSQMESPAELLAHEALQQQFADRLKGGKGDKDFDTAAAIFHI